MLGIRRAIALLFLSFFFWQFLLSALLGPDDIFACFIGLALCYGIGFFALAADWFWARWFATGLGQFGSLALLAIPQVGLEPTTLILGVSHLLIALSLMGEGMAARYEYSEATAERWHFQEESLILMRRAVRSAGMLLPFLILYTLAPKPDFFDFVLLAGGMMGIVGLLRARMWGVFTLGCTGLLLWVDFFASYGLLQQTEMIVFSLDSMPSLEVGRLLLAVFAGSLLFIPFVFSKPMIAFLRKNGA